MVCQSCKKEKNQLHSKISELVKGVPIFMCQSCIDSGFEPRAMIILAGRSFGPESVASYITKHKYVGQPILASELIRES